MNCVYYLCPSKVASSPRCCSEQSFSSSEWQPLLRHKTTAGRQATSESCIYMRKEWGFFCLFVLGGVCLFVLISIKVSCIWYFFLENPFPWSVFVKVALSAYVCLFLNFLSCCLAYLCLSFCQFHTVLIILALYILISSNKFLHLIYPL